jgi:ribosomal protein L12E/L44/L45/RPP1/RPP2
MKHMAAYLLLALGGNKSPSADEVKKILGTVGIETEDERLDQLMSELEGKDLSELLTSGKSLLAKFGSGGGGGSSAAATAGDAAAPEEAKVEEKEEEEEMDLGGGMDMFGGDEGGGGGDY